MQAVFVRHNLAEADIVIDLWNKRLIAIHFYDTLSTDPNDYPTKEGKDSIRRMKGYGETGAIVGATYRAAHPEKILVGEIMPGSLVKGRPFQSNSGKVINLKILELMNVKEISYGDHPLLSAIQPMQKTITGWKSARDYLWAILHGLPIPGVINSLAPSQLEVICYEYLRANQMLAALLLPIGRSLPDIDIYGLDQSANKVIAQVTHRSDIQERLNRLRRYQGQNVKLIMFGPNASRVEDTAIQYIPIEHVFDSLYSDVNSIYHKAIDAMLPSK